MSDDWSPQPPAGPPMRDHDAWSVPAPPAAPRWGAADVGRSAGPTLSLPTAPPPQPPRRSPDPSTGHPSSRRRGGRAAVAAVSVVALIGSGWIARDLLVDDGGTTVVSGTTAAAASGPTPVLPLDSQEPVAAVAQALGPAVVKIETNQGLGSGVIYDAQGLILTNAHVVGSASQVDVVFSDGSTIDGRVLGADELTDVAVVSIDPPGDMAVATLAEEAPAVGQQAIAMGSPFGLEQTVTSGVVSAVGRPVDNPQGAVVEMIQTDAPINPGNSGGALADRAGQVIGINTLIFSQSGENNGIGFAIPIQTALEVADRVVEGRPLERGYLGVSTGPASDGQPGAVVEDVVGGSPADDAGLQRGDRIVGVDGAELKDSLELAARIQSYEPGDAVELQVERDGEVVTLEATLERLEGS